MPELPSLFRIPSLSEQELSPEAGGLLHVDDMLSTGKKQTLESVVSMLKGRFKISVEWIINVGDELDFLKKRLLAVRDRVDYPNQQQTFAYTSGADRKSQDQEVPIAVRRSFRGKGK